MTHLPSKFFCNLSLLVALALFSGLAIPFSAKANPTLPTIRTNIYYATNYGAIGDGTTDNSTAINNAITAANTAGGGVVEITAAATNYMSGPITLKSSVNLQVDAGAELQMFPIATWPGGTFINGSGLHDVEISGSGIIDGNAHFGSNEWWGPINGNPPSGRPNFINFSSSCNRILIQNITLQNPPTFHLMLKGNNANITIQGITINTPGNSPNTDGMDLGSTNILVQNCYISDGDDNIEIGGSSALVAYLTVTNCTFGTGHGVSIGSLIQAGVSNITVVNCSFTGTDNGIRIKSDNDRGGTVQNCSYYNIAMTNVAIPIQIYSYYNVTGTPTSITPQTAASQVVAATNSLTPIYRNITISNITLSGSSTIAGIIWARTEMPATNIFLSKIKMTSPKTFDIYNAYGVTISDCQFTFSSGSTYTAYDAQCTVTNSSPVGVAPITLDGLTTNSTFNTLSLYNTLSSLSNTNLFNNTPTITTGGTTLTVSNHLNLQPGTVLNFALGTNTDSIVVKSNLSLAGTMNINAGTGFAAGTYTLFSYAGTLAWAPPVLGTTPGGYNYALSTNTLGKVNLVVSPIVSVTPVTLTNQLVGGQLKLTWPTDHIGWHLEIQTNNPAKLATNWVAYAGSYTTNQIQIPIATTNGSVFLRLAYP